jgi:hypothetical protein
VYNGLKTTTKITLRLRENEPESVSSMTKKKTFNMVSFFCDNDEDDIVEVNAAPAFEYDFSKTRGYLALAQIS